ncbi:MAG: polysaccharide biosynthesis tyrosine autokinase [Coriobacteriia bacterium]|nr:polysaccharide biosynthesis tyrosine autokinase [Coriobacteriia bacterium]
MELRDYLNVIQARKWVIIQAVVIVTVAAIVVSLVQPKTYEGEARVLVSERDTGAAIFGTVLPELSSQPERGLQTQVQLMQLRPLAENTVRQLGLEMSTEELLKSVEVAALGQTNVVRITARAAEPQIATDIANSIAEEYVAWSRTSKRESIKAAADEVQFRLDDSREQILEIGRRVSSEGKSDELAAELQIATGTYTTLAEKLEQLRINEQLELGSGSIVSAAVVDSKPVSPEPLRNALLGLVVGAGLGLSMAFLYEYLDDTMKTAEEAERLFGAPVLGTIPLEKLDKGQSRRLTIVESPGSSTAESYRVLRNSLDFINFEHKLKTLLITSAAPTEGKSTVAANLASSLAQAGKKVVLVSSDFRRPTTEGFFGVSNVIGLSDVLLGGHSLKAALQRPGDESLLILTSGKMPPNPSELLGSSKMDVLLAELREWADWVIIDSPPLLAVADPAAVARWADGVLLVTKAGVSTRANGKKYVELLGNIGARIIGSVVWGFDERKSPGSQAYYAGGDYYYASYYGKSAQRSDGTMRAAAGVAAPAEPWVLQGSLGRKFAAAVGRIMAGVLAFLAVVVVVALVAYFLDQYFAWGLVRSILGVF